MRDDVGVAVFVGGEQEAESEAAGIGVGVCVGNVFQASGGREACEDGGAGVREVGG